MKTTTLKIATTFTAAVLAGAKGIVTVISAADSSRLGLRYGFSWRNSGVVRQRKGSLAVRLAGLHALPHAAAMCRAASEAWVGRRPSNRLALRPLAAL